MPGGQGGSGVGGWLGREIAGRRQGRAECRKGDETAREEPLAAAEGRCYNAPSARPGAGRRGKTPHKEAEGGPPCRLMFKNILLGCDDSHCSHVALRRAIDLCTRFSARLHLVAVLEEWEWEGAGPTIGAALDPVASALVERREVLDADEPPADIGRAAEVLLPATEACSEAGIGWSVSAVHGDAAMRLLERSRLADLVVLGRDDLPGTANGSSALVRPAAPLGHCARKVVDYTETPVLVTGHQHAPLRSVLAKYVRTPEGGRTLRSAGAFAAEYNLRLDIVACGRDRQEADEALHEARRYLLAYHQEGVYRPLVGPANGHLKAVAVELDSSLLVVPAERHRVLGVLPRTEALSALSVPGASVLIQP